MATTTTKKPKLTAGQRADRQAERKGYLSPLGDSFVVVQNKRGLFDVVSAKYDMEVGTFKTRKGATTRAANLNRIK
jgi:hypothetical protein